MSRVPGPAIHFPSAFGATPGPAPSACACDHPARTARVGAPHCCRGYQVPGCRQGRDEACPISTG